MESCPLNPFFPVYPVQFARRAAAPGALPVWQCHPVAMATIARRARVLSRHPPSPASPGTPGGTAGSEEFALSFSFNRAASARSAPHQRSGGSEGFAALWDRSSQPAASLGLSFHP